MIIIPHFFKSLNVNQITGELFLSFDSGEGHWMQHDSNEKTGSSQLLHDDDHIRPESGRSRHNL
jgi:hypothetical protein